MLRPRSLILVVMLAACAPSGRVTTLFDVEEGITTYTSDRVSLTLNDMSRGLAANQWITLLAEATCEGEGCLPEEVFLIFFNQGQVDLNIDYREIRIDYDEQQIEWVNENRDREQRYFSVPKGEFSRASMPIGVFREIGQAQKVELVFGTARFDLSYVRREAFRQAYETMATR